MPEKKEDFVCRCTLAFPSLAALQAHWADPERAKEVPHYRQLSEDDRDSMHNPYPGMHRDGPQ
jgi:hypothetical protein